MDSDTSADFYSDFSCDSDTSHKRKREKIEMPFHGTPSLHDLFKRKYVKLKAVKKILALGADIEEKNGQLKHTPLHVAVMNYKTDVVEYLLEQGADVFARTTDGNTALHLNAFAWTSEISSQLLMSGADCNAQNERGETPTHNAAKFADAAFLRNFIDFGADTSIKDIEGNTVLHHAASRRVAYGKDDDSYDDPILDARWKRYMIRLLLQYDGNWCKLEALQATNNKGETASDVAFRYSNEETAGNELEAALIPAKEEALLRSISAKNAFAMGHHERLGAASIVKKLDPDVMRMILGYI